MLSEHIASIGLSLFTEVLIETCKKSYGIVKTKHDEAKHKDLLHNIFVAHLQNEFDDILSSKAFEVFAGSMHIREYISDYEGYLIFGRLYQKSKQKHAAITDSEVIDYLTSQFMSLYDDETISKPQDTHVRAFIKALHESMIDYIGTFLKPNEKNMISLINSNSNMNALAIMRHIEWLVEKLAIDTQCVSVITPDYSHNIQEYHQRLQRTYSQAHVYLMDKFLLDDFYVCPNISYSNRDLLKDNSSFAIPEDCPTALLIRIGFIDWTHIFDINNIVYVIGGAGYGKSMFLRYLIRKYKEMSFIDADKYLLMYVELRDCYSKSGDPEKSVLDMLQESMIKNTGMDREQLPKALISEYLDAGRCIILFDALDEVPKDYRNALHNKLISYFEKTNRNNKICITSRSRGFIPDDQVHTLNLLPLTEEQIDRYVENMIRLGRFARENKEDFLQQARRLVDSQFLNSFLVLSLLISIYRAENDLPNTKLDLYKKCFEYIARKRELEKGGDFNWALMRSLLDDNAFIELANLCSPNNVGTNKLAINEKLLNEYEFEYQDRNEARNAIDEFLRFCSERTEVFVPDAAEDTYKFFHRSFYEYFYSQYIVTRSKEAEAIYKILVATDWDSEIFELVIAILKSTNMQLCNGVINLMCDHLEEKLSIDKNVCNELHIIGIVSNYITNRHLSERIVTLLCTYASHLAHTADNYIVHDMLARFILNDPEYTNRITEAYTNYAYEEMLTYVKRILEEFSLFYKTPKKAPPIPSKEFFRHIIMAQLSFFSKVLLQQCPANLVKMLTDMKKTWLKSRYRTSKTGQRSYKLADGQISQMIQLLTGNEATHQGNASELTDHSRQIV